MKTTREMPLTKFEWNRFQVGIMEKKQEQYPCYHWNRKNQKVIKLNDAGTTADVFHLLGWGKTESDANKMAKSKLLLSSLL